MHVVLTRFVEPSSERGFHRASALRRFFAFSLTKHCHFFVNGVWFGSEIYLRVSVSRRGSDNAAFGRMEEFQRYVCLIGRKLVLVLE